MIIWVIILFVSVVFLGVLLACDEPGEPQRKPAKSSNIKSHNTQDDYYDTDYPDYNQQNLQRIMRENAQRMHNQAMQDAQCMHEQAVRDAEHAHKEFVDTQWATMDMHNNTMDFSCGGFGPFF